jgi:hypothetical protein
MSTFTEASFKHLPAELRAKIYAEMSPLLKVLANKVFHAEAEGEWIRNIKIFLKDIMALWDKTHTSPLRITMPSTVPEIKRVEIAIPLDSSC